LMIILAGIAMIESLPERSRGSNATSNRTLLENR
jgi:hypothetical protein